MQRPRNGRGIESNGKKIKCQWTELADNKNTWPFKHTDKAEVGVIVNGVDWKLCEWHAKYFNEHPEVLGRK